MGLGRVFTYIIWIPSIKNLPTVDEVAYFFRDFRLNPDGIRPLPTESERLAQEQLELQQGQGQGQDECVACLGFPHMLVALAVDRGSRRFDSRPNQATASHPRCPHAHTYSQQQQRHKPRLSYHQQQHERQFRSFVVKFDSPDEAQRAIREKQMEHWGQGKVHIVSYK